MRKYELGGCSDLVSPSNERGPSPAVDLGCENLISWRCPRRNTVRTPDSVEYIVTVRVD